MKISKPKFSEIFNKSTKFTQQRPKVNYPGNNTDFDHNKLPQEDIKERDKLTLH